MEEVEAKIANKELHREHLLTNTQKCLQALCFKKKLSRTGTKAQLAHRIVMTAHAKVPVIEDVRKFVQGEQEGKPTPQMADRHPFGYYQKHFNGVDWFDRLLYEILWGKNSNWQQMYIKSLLWGAVVNCYSLFCEHWSTPENAYSENIQGFTENICLLINRQSREVVLNTQFKFRVRKNGFLIHR